MTKPLIFYVDQRWRRPGIHTPLLNPWWGNPYEEVSVFSKEMFDHYSPANSSYQITEKLSEADLVLVPYGHNRLLNSDRALLQECIDTAKANKLPLLVDGSADIEYPLPEGEVYALRYSGYRFLPTAGRIQVPLMVDDLLERCCAGELKLREKSLVKPIVGFAGWAKLSPSQYLKTIAKEFPIRLRSLFDERYRACFKGVLWRQQALKILQKSSKISLNLRLRRSFSANQKTAEGDVKQLQREMVETILESDYALDIRGDANNSARLFEILSLGRIPVIVDTERILPFSDEIDYRSFALIVDFRDLARLPQIIADFHEQISPEEFKQRQLKAREVFVKYFRIDAFMKQVVEELRREIGETTF